ncbi:hypothetical protein [Zobellia roscoffensis]|uniref:hypothetical protein n=1 Tax=Zobellia roscoffensis TaxID=2779508 RepID=UPI00188AC09E|nr:hypothetical protein [Zobellia roscoffensis]
MENNHKYINFPIQLLKGFLLDPQKVLYEISCYALFFYENSPTNNTHNKFIGVCTYLGYDIRPSMRDEMYQIGQNLHDKFALKSRPPLTGIKVQLLKEFQEEEHTKEEMLYFLAFLAIKSILYKKPYAKITNNFLLSRMDGRAKCCAKKDLSPEIRKYSSNYHMQKIRLALYEKWHVVSESKYMRGVLYSIKHTKEELITIAEKNRQTYKKKQEQYNTKKLREKVRKDLNSRLK